MAFHFPAARVVDWVSAMDSRTIGKLAIPATLLLAALGTLANAQRPAESTAPVVTRQDPEFKPAAQSVTPREQATRHSSRAPASRSLPAPRPPKSARSGEIQPRPRVPRDRLYLSAQPDGSPQVRGRTYKAEFTRAGASYIPFFGPAAAQNHPLGLRIASIRSGGEELGFDGSASATRDGSTVRYARGSVVESYELGLDSVEQRFTFPSLPATGELVLRLAVASDLIASAEGGALSFSCADGTLRYGAATVLDAGGASAALRTEIDGDSIVLRVPARFLAAARFPVTIDPVLSVFPVSWQGTSYDDQLPSIAWDETNQLYCVVFEEAFSASDHDVVCTFQDADGNPVWADYLDATLSDYWARPDVANNNEYDNFLVVAQVGLPSNVARTIHGRLIDAATSVLGPDLLISTADASGEKINPSVGGDPYASGTVNYAVVWQRIYSAGSDDDIHYRYVDPTGALVGMGTGVIDNSANTLDRRPRISRSCGAGGLHHVVWQREFGPTDHDVYAAELDFQGSVTIGSTPVAYSAGDETASGVASCLDVGGQWLLVYELNFGSDRDVIAALMSGVNVVDSIDLSEFESFYDFGTGLYLEDQRHPAADSDGSRFAVAYAESYGGSTTDYDVYVTTLDVLNGLLMLGEFHQNLAFSNTHEDFPRLCATAGAGGAGWRTAAVWYGTGGPGLGDIEAALYDLDAETKFCFPGLDGVRACPCGNTPLLDGAGCYNSSLVPASIWQLNTASLSADTAVLLTMDEKPTAPSIVAQGSALIPAGVNFGQGMRCTGGTLKRLYLRFAVGGSISVPGAGDPDLHTRSAALGDPLSPGSVRYYFVYYRDPLVLPGCPASAGFNATDTVQVVWRP